jgi:omega-hydroxy-beta-dihydromenaquinone-9 sulfotransferase
MYIDLGLFAKAEYLAFFKARLDLRRWSYIFFFTALYWLMWIVVALGRALDHALFPGFKRQPVRQPVFIVASPRTGSTLTQKLMSLDEKRFVCNALYQTVFPAVTFQRCFDALVWLDRKAGRPFERVVQWAEKKWFGGWDEMHKLRFNQPEEDDGFFVYTFVTEAIFLLFLHIDQLWQAGFLDALPLKKRRKVMAFYGSCLQRRLYASGPEKTILSKATQSSGAVESLLETFPDAKFITIIRHPYESVASHVSVFWPVWRAHSPALKKDGPESKAYARLAVRWFQHLFAFREKVDPRHYYCIDYRELTRDPKATLEKLYRHFDWTMSETFREQLTRANGRQHYFESNHKYSLEEFGLSEEWIQQELGSLLDYYALNDGTRPRLTRPSLGSGAFRTHETPPSYVQQTERDQQKAVACHGGGCLRSMEALNSHQQCERDVAIARPEGHDLAAAAIRAAQLPPEKQ